MKILLAKNAGFCPGVRRAVETLEGILSSPHRPCRIVTLGELIHNPIYTASLKERGVEITDEDGAARAAAESDVRGRTALFLRTHGVSRATEERLRTLEEMHPRFEVHDLTCPFVKKVHHIAEAASDAFFLFGKQGHPEVEGTLDRAPCRVLLFGSADDLSRLTADKNTTESAPIAAAQTTMGLEEWEKSKKILKKLYTNAKIFDTICGVTKKRQEETRALAAQADVTIVIGGRHSSNTKELYEIASSVCRDTRLIEHPSELLCDFSDGITVAITAGASTPDGLIMEVYKAMDEIRTEDFAELLEGTLKTLNTGETVTGIVTSIAKDVVYVDVGVKATGMVARDQITDDQNANLADMFKIGDELRLFVIRVSDTDGIVTLSKKRVDRDKSWFDLVAMKDEGGIVEGPVVESNKGGVVIEALGNRVFVPASRTGLPKDADFSTLVGTTQRARIIDIDEQRKRAVASIRSVMIEEKRAEEQAIWDKLEVGQRYTGVVKNLTTYGAFVDIGGVDGMVHNTELSWKHIRHPKEVVAVGQELSVYIKDLDAEKRRISLGYKSEENDPWALFNQQYKLGDVVTAKVVSMTSFGAFAEVMDGVDGLIHISRISLEKIARPQDALEIGQEVTVKIVEIDNERRRLSLSIRALLEEAKRAEEQAVRDAERAERDAAREAAAKERAELEAEMAPYIVRSID